MVPGVRIEEGEPRVLLIWNREQLFTRETTEQSGVK